MSDKVIIRLELNGKFIWTPLPKQSCFGNIRMKLYEKYKLEGDWVLTFCECEIDDDVIVNDLNINGYVISLKQVVSLNQVGSKSNQLVSMKVISSNDNISDILSLCKKYSKNDLFAIGPMISCKEGYYCYIAGFVDNEEVLIACQNVKLIVEPQYNLYVNISIGVLIDMVSRKIESTNMLQVTSDTMIALLDSFSFLVDKEKLSSIFLKMMIDRPHFFEDDKFAEQLLNRISDYHSSYVDDVIMACLINIFFVDFKYHTSKIHIVKSINDKHKTFKNKDRLKRFIEHDKVRLFIKEFIKN